MPAEVGVRVGGHDAGLTTPPHTVSPPPSPPRLSIPHLICQLSALPDARFGGRDENCGLAIGEETAKAYSELLRLAKIKQAAGQVANLDVAEATANLNEVEDQVRQ